jgi:non-ribosomal peptide synthetase component F
MEMASMIDSLLGIIVAGGAWFIITLSNEVKRLSILLNRTREDYATKTELRDDMNRLLEALHRVEDKLDRILSGKLK